MAKLMVGFIVGAGLAFTIYLTTHVDFSFFLLVLPFAGLVIAGLYNFIITTWDNND
jgi:hypothetical protein